MWIEKWHADTPWSSWELIFRLCSRSVNIVVLVQFWLSEISQLRGTWASLESLNTWMELPKIWHTSESDQNAVIVCWFSYFLRNFDLTHSDRVTHVCFSKLIMIGSDNGLSPGRRQAILWTNAGILLIGPVGINFSEIFNRNLYIFNSENACENVVRKLATIFSRPQCVNGMRQMLWFQLSSWQLWDRIATIMEWWCLKHEIKIMCRIKRGKVIVKGLVGDGGWGNWWGWLVGGKGWGWFVGSAG